MATFKAPVSFHQEHPPEYLFGAFTTPNNAGNDEGQLIPEQAGYHIKILSMIVEPDAGASGTLRLRSSTSDALNGDIIWERDITAVTYFEVFPGDKSGFALSDAGDSVRLDHNEDASQVWNISVVYVYMKSNPV